MTNEIRQQLAFYRRTGLQFLGISFRRAMSHRSMRIAIIRGAQEALEKETKGKPAPSQPALI